MEQLQRKVIRVVQERKDKLTPASWPGWSTSSSVAALVAGRVAGDEADVVAQVFVPAWHGAGRVVGGVPAIACDLRVGVAGVRVDGDPTTFSRQTPLFHRAGGQRAFEELAAVQGEADRAGAVVAGVPPASVAAAPYIRL